MSKYQTFFPGNQVKHKKHGVGTVMKTDPDGVVVRFNSDEEGGETGTERVVKEGTIKKISPKELSVMLGPNGTTQAPVTASEERAAGYCDCCDNAECICAPEDCHCAGCKIHAKPHHIAAEIDEECVVCGDKADKKTFLGEFLCSSGDCNEVYMEENRERSHPDADHHPDNHEESAVHADALPQTLPKFPVATLRNMLGELYAGLLRPLGYDDGTIAGIQQLLHSRQIPDSMIKQEWESIQHTDPSKLMEMIRQLPAAAETHPEKVEELQRLYQDVAEGVARTLEAGQDIDPATYQAVDRIIMEFTDKFLDEVAGGKQLTGPEQPLLEDDSAIESSTPNGDDDSPQERFEREALQPMLQQMSLHPPKPIREAELEDEHGNQVGVIKVVQETHPSHAKMIGIHLEDPEEHDIDDAIETAAKDGFDYVWVRYSPKVNNSVETAKEGEHTCVLCGTKKGVEMREEHGCEFLCKECNEDVKKKMAVKSALVQVVSKQWSGGIKTKWQPKEGFFNESADKIAEGLKSGADSLKQAMARLTFYINRSGDNLSADDKKRLELAKEKLHKLYDSKTKSDVEVAEEVNVMGGEEGIAADGITADAGAQVDRIFITDQDSVAIGKPWEVKLYSWGDLQKQAEHFADKFFGPGQWKWDAALKTIQSNDGVSKIEFASAEGPVAEHEAAASMVRQDGDDSLEEIKRHEDKIDELKKSADPKHKQEIADLENHVAGIRSRRRWNQSQQLRKGIHTSVQAAMDPEARKALLEELAALEHEQWQHWAESVKAEVSPERAQRWEAYFVPYEQLDRPAQKLDLEWAEKVMEIIEPHMEQKGSGKELVTRFEVDAARFPELAAIFSSEGQHIEGIADYICNALENGDQQEHEQFIVEEFGTTPEQAKKLVELGYQIMTQPLMLNDELFPMIEQILGGGQPVGASLVMAARKGKKAKKRKAKRAKAGAKKVKAKAKKKPILHGRKVKAAPDHVVEFPFMKKVDYLHGSLDNYPVLAEATGWSQGACVACSTVTSNREGEQYVCDMGCLKQLKKGQGVQASLEDYPVASELVEAALSPLVEQYLATALWSSTDDDGNPLDDKFSTNSFTSEAVQTAERDVDAFLQKAGPLVDGLDLTDVMHDFWLTRNGHGAGFWDGDYAEDIGEKLTALSKEFGEQDVYVGDDRRLHLSGGHFPGEQTEMRV